jgi:hypothetical protein
MGEVNMRALMDLKQRSFTLIFVLLFLALFAPSIARAQDDGRSNVVLDLTKAVLFDPTTYAPATLSYTSQRMDWKTSQALFNAGWVEHNARFTVSGRPDDKPISFAAGNRQIRRDALAHLQESVVNNFEHSDLRARAGAEVSRASKTVQSAGLGGADFVLGLRELYGVRGSFPAGAEKPGMARKFGIN